MTSDANKELEARIAATKAEILTFGPREQAVCLRLLEAVQSANAVADLWAKECDTLCTSLFATHSDPNANHRQAIMDILMESHERMIRRLASMKESMD